MEWKVPLADLDYGVEEEEAVVGVLRSRWLTMGGVTQRFEAAFGEFTGAAHALAVSNATVGLHLACLAVGVGPGDEVIAPALTFVASTNAVLYTGAEVRFAEIKGAEDLNLSPEAAEAQIGPRTKAIVVVHYGGYPCDMVAFRALADRYGLALIEDAAHAPGAWLEGRHLGTWGDVGVFSFFSNKNLSTGEGGMVVTGRADLAERLRLLRSHGMTSLTWDRHKGHAYTYDVTALGYNYRIDEIRAALGLAQLGKLEAGNARRAAITRQYWEALAGSGLRLPFCGREAGTGSKSSYHIMPVLLPEEMERLRFIDRLRAAGIQTSIHYPPVHRFSYYQERYPVVSLPVTEGVAGREVTLPLYATMTDAQVTHVIEAVKDCLGV